MDDILVFLSKEELQITFNSLSKTLKDSINDSDTLTESEMNLIKLITKIHEELEKDKEDKLKIS